MATVIVPAVTVVIAWFGLRWYGQSWDRGLDLAGLLGLTVIAASQLASSLGCGVCLGPIMFGCTFACTAVSVIGGILIGRRASRERHPVRVATGALALLTVAGLLACGTTGVIGGLGGAIVGVASALPAGLFARRC